MPPLVIAGLALAAGKLIKGFIDKGKANGIDAEYTPYQESPYAKEQLATARQAYNGRMAGAANEERNIDTSQAGYNHAIERNASSGAQALALEATGQSRSNEAYNQLAIKEQQNKYGLMANLNAAYQGMTNEQDKVYQSKLQKYYMDINQKRALNASGDANIFGAVSDGAVLAFGGGAGAMGGANASEGADSFNQSSMIGAEGQFVGANASPASAYGTSIPQSSYQLWNPNKN